MLVVSTHIVAVDVGVVLVGDIGVVKPLVVLEEGEELSVSNRIDRAGNSALQKRLSL